MTKLNNSLLESAAIVAHEANKVYCESLGDFSQVHWNEAPEWQKDSARAGVLFVYENPDVTPAQSHENWMKQKMEEGWKYGPVKDPIKKEHPCIMIFDMLPVSQQYKDHLFRAVVKGYLSARSHYTSNPELGPAN